MNRNMLEAVTRYDIKRLSEAIMLSAKRGHNPMGLREMLVSLTLWLKSGRNDFAEWNRLCCQTSDEWTEWYKQYKGETS